MMSLTKKLFALLLALALALGLALPTFAGGEPDPAMPVITKQPEDVKLNVNLFGDAEFTLRIEAYIPNGDPVGYQWWYDLSNTGSLYVPIEGATGSTFTASTADYGSSLYCVVYNAAEGPEGTHSAASRKASVTTFLGLLPSILVLVVSVAALPFSLLVPVFLLPMLFIPFPLTMLCIGGIMEGVSGIWANLTQ